MDYCLKRKRRFQPTYIVKNKAKRRKFIVLGLMLCFAAFLFSDSLKSKIISSSFLINQDLNEQTNITVKSHVDNLIIKEAFATEQPPLLDPLVTESVVDTEEVKPVLVEEESNTLSNLKSSQNSVHYDLSGLPRFERIPKTFESKDGVLGVYDQYENFVSLTLNADLQKSAETILKRYRLPWGALVAMDPTDGRVLAIASYSEHSRKEGNLATRSGFPAASLFKLITASAAIEYSGANANDTIYYRGSDYALNRYNFLPDKRKDNKKISLAKALGKSCNPAFARLALAGLSSSILERYAHGFGFNSAIPFEFPLEESVFNAPEGDYEISRTSAGFGNVTISPLHAAAITSAIAHDGRMMQPHIVEKVVGRNSGIVYQYKPKLLRSVMLPETANEILKMMESTMDGGTGKNYKGRLRAAGLGNLRISAKTGTLSGKFPKGVYRWLVAAAPANNPTIAIAALVIDPGNAREKGTGVGIEFLKSYFNSSK